MAEQQLHGAQVGAVVEQVGGEGMAQRVRRQRFARDRRARVRLIRCQKAWRVIAAPRAVTNAVSDCARWSSRGRPSLR